MLRAQIALCALVALLPACGAEGQAPPVIAAAGDIACDPADANFNGGNGTASACRMKATSDLMLGLGLTAVLNLGDNQYENGTLAKYQASYAPTWGRLDALIRPVPGNHEYLAAGASGYFSYFGAAAGDPAKGYYSYDLGGWHLIALNSNCAAVGGCGAGSPQGPWLAADLAAHPGTCTLAYWHHPRFSSGPHGNDAISDPFWQALYTAGADVILNGHDHIYERFAPQSPAGAADPQGIRQFTVGTGGKNLTSIQVVKANSEVRNASAFGVLEMTLHPNGYTWRFLSASGGAVLDQGAAFCHSAALPWSATDFHTLPPCRVADTRKPAGELGGPALAANGTRSFPAAGTCGVPADAVAVAANVTAVNPAAAGFLEIRPNGGLPTGTTTLSFAPGQLRSNNGLLLLGVGGAVAVSNASAGAVHFVLDVSGYFR